MGATADVRALGIVVLYAPELPARLADDVARDLPTLLEQRLGVSCSLSKAAEPVLGDEDDRIQVVEVAKKLQREQDWSVALCLTDLPMRAGERPIAAAASASDRVAIVSLPAFGVTRLRPRVLEAAVRLISEIVQPEPEGEGAGPLVRRRPVELLTPIRSAAAPEDRLPTQFTMAPVLGHLRLLAGMVRANRPWRAMSGLSTAVIAALATGAYAVLNSIVWMLSGALSPLRLAGVMIAAIVAIVVYLILSHRLWFRADGGHKGKDAGLYNAATVLTLLSAVTCAYLILFVALFLAALIVVDANIFRSQVSHPVDALSYLRLAWLGASLATVAGALGSGLESIEEVREAAYGHHQRQQEG